MGADPFGEFLMGGFHHSFGFEQGDQSCEVHIGGEVAFPHLLPPLSIHRVTRETAEI